MEYPISKVLIGRTEENLKVIITACAKFSNEMYIVENQAELRITMSNNYDETEVRSVGELIANKLDKYESFSVESELNNSELTYLLEDLILTLTPINLYNQDFEVVTKYLENKEHEDILNTASNNAYAYNIVRILNHLPHNIVNPDFMSSEVVKLFEQFSNVKVSVLRKKEIEAEQLNGHLAVSQGSKQEPAFIKIEYITDPTLKKIGIVGKGMTFDIGGYNIKSQRDLRSMKKDMAGANGVIGCLLTLAYNQSMANVTGYLCVTDNLINSQAMLPGDIVEYKNDVNVEIINTDAEGRMVLADGLIMAELDKNEIIIDICTLTGAIFNAIGDAGAGLFSKDIEFVRKAEEISQTTTEKGYAMPYISQYDERLKSDVADITHLVVEGGAGSIIAALFLDHFVENATHLHIDMAAMSEKKYLGVGSNGYGTRLLTKLVSEL